LSRRSSATAPQRVVRKRRVLLPVSTASRDVGDDRGGRPPVSAFHFPPVPGNALPGAVSRENPPSACTSPAASARAGATKGANARLTLPLRRGSSSSPGRFAPVRLHAAETGASRQRSGGGAGTEAGHR